MAATPRLALPFLSVGQAQKEFTHNESLQALDVLVAGAIEEPPRTAPPDLPVVGACYVIGPNPTGAWAAMPACIAAWTTGGWRFISPLEGMSLYERSSGTWATFRDGVWELGMVRGGSLVVNDKQVVGSRAAAIDSPAGGNVIDSEARAALSAVLDALRQHGLIDS